MGRRPWPSSVNPGLRTDSTAVEVDVAYTFLHQRQQEPGVELEDVVRDTGENVLDQAEASTGASTTSSPTRSAT